MRVLSLCDGMSCGLLAFKNLGIEPEYWAVEIDKFARALSDSNFKDIKRPCNDVNEIGARQMLLEWPAFNWVIFGSPCFARGTKVLTATGYVPIEDIKIGDLVLTHMGRFRKVLDTGHKVAPIRRIKFKGMKEILTTDEHPFLCRETTRTYNASTRSYDRKFSEEKWVEAKDVIPLNVMGKMAHIADTSDMGLDPTTCWLIGRFLADGHIIHRNRTEKGREKDFIYQIVLSVGERKLQNVLDSLISLKKSYRKHSTSTYRVTVHSKKLVTLFRELGIKNGAATKALPVKILQLPPHLLKIVLEGYLAGDGHKDKYGFWCANSVSEDLMLGMQIAAAKVYGVGAGYSFSERQKTTVIEGRTVNQKDTNLIRFPEDTRRSQSRQIDGGIYVTCKINSPIGELAEVFNLEVEEDNTYTANNVVVHNCQSVSVAGKGEGLDGTSGLLLKCMEILALAKHRNPNVKFLIENVKMKKDFKAQFDQIIGGESILINSALVSAQNRERYYWTDFPVGQPSDRGLVIADILEDAAFFSEREKSYCITANYSHGVSAERYLKRGVRQIVFKYSESSRYKREDGSTTQKANEAVKREVERRRIPSDKALTLTTGDGCGSGMKAINLVGLPRGFNRGYSRPVEESKAPSISKSSWEQNNKLVIQVNPDKSCGGKQPKMQDRVYSPVGKSVAMTSFAGRTNVGDELFYRKLTVRECARLQTIPEWYSFDAVSKTQAYKAIGNGWTVEVIAHIISESMAPEMRGAA